MPIYAPKNLYVGVNPHLNSALQTRGGEGRPALWEGFHSAHIGHIRLYLNQHLPGNYIAYSEQSPQIAGGDESGPRKPKPDVSIVRKFPGNATSGVGVAASPTWEAELWQVLEPVDEWMSVVIGEVVDGVIGQVVTRIELLSPSNKPGGAHFAAYKISRYECAKNGTPLIEIDYLHEQGTLIPYHPVYPHEADSYAFTIAVSDPRPEHGKTQVYGFGVCAAVPRVQIPLAGKETFLTDFDAIYQVHFEQDRLYMAVDYSQLPERFESYSAQDQAQIRKRMAEIAAEYENQN
jgi:hypothetical protein